MAVSRARRALLLRPEGPKTGVWFMARRAESAGVVYMEGAVIPLPTNYMGLGSAVSGPPTAKRFCLYLNAPDAFPATVFGLTHLCNEGTSKTYLSL